MSYCTAETGPAIGPVGRGHTHAFRYPCPGRRRGVGNVLITEPGARLYLGPRGELEESLAGARAAPALADCITPEVAAGLVGVGLLLLNRGSSFVLPALGAGTAYAVRSGWLAVDRYLP